jgi:hypothetical protein
VLLASVAAMEAVGIDGLIYSHPTGDHMHASGPSVGLVDLENQAVPVFGDLEVSRSIPPSSSALLHPPGNLPV